ncbi:MAG: hypothetical protein U0528_02755 [Anaerolineae bacterium]
MQHFYDLAADRTRNLRANWRSIVENGAQAEVNASLDHLAALDAGSTDFLAFAAVLDPRGRVPTNRASAAS